MKPREIRDIHFRNYDLCSIRAIGFNDEIPIDILHFVVLMRINSSNAAITVSRMSDNRSMEYLTSMVMFL